MLVYWSLVLFPAFFTFTEGGHRNKGRGGGALLPLLFVVLFCFLGFRETGGDYPAYLELFHALQGEPLETAMRVSEPLYGALNWLSDHFDLGIYGVNSACALIFLYALFRAAYKEAYPLFFVTLAMPYFVIVVGMGYTRQGVAASLILLSMVYLREGHPWRAMLAILAGAGFHYSALAAAALPMFYATRHHSGVVALFSRAFLLGFLAVASQWMLSDQIDAYTANYVEAGHYESGGAFLRSIVTGLASVAFFALRREFMRAYDDYELWRPLAFLGLICPPLSFFFSTPVDRIGLYLIPFQLVTFARLPDVWNNGHSFVYVRTLILTNYLVYFFVWIHLGSYSSVLWLPYRWLFS
jgi:hypothetical protein